MANKTFLGTGANPADWSATDNWTGAALPANGDNILIGNIPMDVSTGLSALSAISIATFQVTQACTKRLGGSSTAISLAAITSKLLYGGAGEYCKISASGTVALALLNPTAGTFYIAGGTWTTVRAGGAIVEISGTATVTTLLGVASEVRDEYNATGYTTFEIASGNAFIKRDIATGAVSQGSLTVMSTAAVTTKLNVYSGGTYNHQSSGSIAEVDVRPGGTFTPAGAVSDFTVTAFTIWEGGSFFDTEQGIVIATPAYNAAGAKYIGKNRRSNA